jgi:hypothetical protein
MTDPLPLKFIDEPIEVFYEHPPVHSKSPTCPDGFVWMGVELKVQELMAEWHDFTRRGKMSRNMRPVHLDRAAMTGSWGVGRYTFRVRVEDGRIFDLYYDRAPEDAFDRMGSWYLFGERISTEK